MSLTIEKIVKTVSESGMIRLIVIAFMFGMVWSRMEYKSEADKMEVISAINAHIVQDAEQKKSIEYRLGEADKKIASNVVDIKFLYEFLRPEDVTISRGRRYR